MDHQSIPTVDDTPSVLGDLQRMLRICRGEPLDAAALRQLASALTVKWGREGTAPETLASDMEQGADGVFPPVRWDVLRDRCQGDVGFCRELLQMFTQRVADQLQAIEEAVAAGNAAMLARKAHAAKSVAATLAAEPVCRCAAELEHLGRRENLAAAAALMPRLREEVHRCLQYIPQLLAAIAAAERPLADASETG